MRCHLLGKIDLKCRATLLRKALQGINCDLSAEAKVFQSFTLWVNCLWSGREIYFLWSVVDLHEMKMRTVIEGERTQVGLASHTTILRSWKHVIQMYWNFFKFISIFALPNTLRSFCVLVRCLLVSVLSKLMRFLAYFWYLWNFLIERKLEFFLGFLTSQLYATRSCQQSFSKL